MKIFLPKEEDSYEGTRSMQNTKASGPEKKVPLAYEKQNTKHNIRKKERILKAAKKAK